METVLSCDRKRAEANERAAVAAAIREAIQRSGLSQAEFASRIGTSPSRLSHLRFRESDSCQRTSQNPCGRTDGSRRRTSNPCRRTARFPFGGQCSHAATGKTMLPRRFRCSGRRRPCAPDRLATGRRGSACVHAPGSPGTERSMAVSSSDPFWLLCAIRWVVSAERDFLVSTDK
jgi:hypothetical protein